MKMICDRLVTASAIDSLLNDFRWSLCKKQRVEYFSRLVEIQKLTSTTSRNDITALKSIFAQHGISVTLVTDNEPKFISNEINFYPLTDFTMSPVLIIISQMGKLNMLLKLSNHYYRYLFGLAKL